MRWVPVVVWYRLAGLRPCDAMRCDAMRCDAMRCDAMRCDAMRCDAMRCDAMRCDAMRCARTPSVGMNTSPTLSSSHSHPTYHLTLHPQL